MEIIYQLSDTYFNIFIKIYSAIFTDKVTIMSFAIFTAYLPLARMPMSMFSDEDSNGFKEWFIGASIFSFMMTLVVYFFSAGFERWSGAYGFWVLIFMIASGFAQQARVQTIADGIKRSQDDGK